MNYKKLGAILILIGVCCPIGLYPFATPDLKAFIMQVAFAQRGVSYHPRLSDLELVISSGEWTADTQNTGHFEGRFAIGYPKIVLVGLILGITGACLYFRSRNK